MESAVPAPLAAVIRSFVDDLQCIAVNALVGVGNEDPAQADRLCDGETQSGRIADCDGITAKAELGCL